ncbi:unnamed protein product [Chrysodeixis includens]|uniref:Tetraspanin n=1 Tax=Chrysodeixis includens TaxID=689277 RepID=A0A9P0BV90_CHRIL|nr:unnamed protein product [Chrysodeixis includens]
MWRGFAKYVIYSVNLIFTLIGLLIIALGAFVVIKYNEINIPSAVSDANLQFFPYVIIVFGLIIFIVSFSGCCGAGTQMKWLLILYTVFLSILAVLKLALAVLLFISNVKDAVDSQLTTSFGKADGSFQVFESFFECCGTYGPDSYNNTENLVPFTCCKGYSGKEALTCSKADAYPEGCLTKVAAKVSTFLRNIGISLLVIMAFELTALGVTIYLIRTIKPKMKCEIEKEDEKDVNDE